MPSMTLRLRYRVWKLRALCFAACARGISPIVRLPAWLKQEKVRPPLGGKGGRSGYQFRADWLGLDRRGTASGKARRHRTPWLDDSQCGAGTLDPNVLLRREGPVNF
jgi:hypothetical protein